MEASNVWNVLKQLTEELGEMLGSSYEIVLHDFQNPESSIVAITHGDISGRSVGDSTTNLGLPFFRDAYTHDSVFHYRTQTKSGKTLKSSSLFLKDDAGKVFAALCFNWDISQLQVASHILRELIAISDDPVDEVLTSDIGDVLTKVIDDTISACNKPIDALTREDKRHIVDVLDEKGVFSVKRSVDRVASALSISRVTVYGYLSEIRANKANHVI